MKNRKFELSVQITLKTLVIVWLAAHTLQPPVMLAQESAKQKGKGHIECWVKCCWEIGCKWVSGAAASATRRAENGAQVKVKGDQVMAEFKSTTSQSVFEVKQATRLAAETAESLGYKEITLLPGQYAITPTSGGLATVAIKAKIIPQATKETYNKSTPKN